MKGIFRSFHFRQPKWRFQAADLSESTEVLANPARGWYQIYTFQIDKEPDFKEVEWCLDHKDTLALVMIDIGDYRDRDLDEDGLGRIRSILDFFEKNRYDIILRVVYDHEGRAMEREPFFFKQVQQHLTQLGPVLTEYAGTVFVFQGLLVGNWGEMHTSRFLAEDKLSSMANILRTFRKEEMYLAVRRPMYWRLLHPCGSRQEIECLDGMGLFDDGMFGSESHLGTFGAWARECAGWTGAWNRAEEMAFEQELCQLAPNGGEAVYEETYQKTLTQESMIEDLRTMHVTYLNRIYDSRILDIWKGLKYSGQGVWAGKSVYEYIGAHLGYRLLIKKVALTGTKTPDGMGILEITIENTGFASLYQEAECYLEYENQDGQHRQRKLEGSMKGWRSNETRTLSCPVELCECALFLRVQRKKDGAAISFANGEGEAGRTAIGMMRTV